VGGKQAIYTVWCLLQAKTRPELKDSRRPRGDATVNQVQGGPCKHFTRIGHDKT
jgi:hypothetical protein